MILLKYVNNVMVTYEDAMTVVTRNALCEIIKILKRIQHIEKMG